MQNPNANLNTNITWQNIKYVPCLHPHLHLKKSKPCAPIGIDFFLFLALAQWAAGRRCWKSRATHTLDIYKTTNHRHRRNALFHFSLHKSPLAFQITAHTQSNCLWRVTFIVVVLLIWVRFWSPLIIKSSCLSLFHLNVQHFMSPVLIFPLSNPLISAVFAAYVRFRDACFRSSNDNNAYVIPLVVYTQVIGYWFISKSIKVKSKALWTIISSVFSTVAAVALC